jgi:hypothetical protein
MISKMESPQRKLNRIQMSAKLLLILSMRERHSEFAIRNNKYFSQARRERGSLPAYLLPFLPQSLRLDRRFFRQVCALRSHERKNRGLDSADRQAPFSATKGICSLCTAARCLEGKKPNATEMRDIKSHRWYVTKSLVLSLQVRVNSRSHWPYRGQSSRAVG